MKFIKKNNENKVKFDFFIIFYRLGPLGRVGHRVVTFIVLSVCGSVGVLLNLAQYFLFPFFCFDDFSVFQFFRVFGELAYCRADLHYTGGLLWIALH